MKPENVPEWFRLDNAAKIFPAVDTASRTTMFRLSATLDEPIDAEMLQRAVDNLAERFPYFQVKLRAGVFWHYLQRVDDRLMVEQEREAPCSPLDALRSQRLLYRVLFFDRRISTEFSHIMTDGAGGLAYCKALVGEYLRLGGTAVGDWGDLMRPGQPLSPEEYEDAYQRYNEESIPPPPTLERAFQLPERLVSPPFLTVITGLSPVAPVLDLARAAGVSLGEYLSALYLKALYDYLMDIPEPVRSRLLRPIRLIIPVDARRQFGVSTMRNFVLHVVPGIDPRLGTYRFEEILGQVHHFMRVELNTKFLQQQIARNMRGETNPFIRITPLVLKVPIERILYQKYGNAIASGVFSNLGSVSLPPAIAERVERFDFITVPNPDTKVSVGVISYRGTLAVTFGSLIHNRAIERRFFRELRARGVPVKVETNDPPEPDIRREPTGRRSKGS